MKVTEGIVRTLSNLSDKKLHEVLKGNRTYKPDEIIAKAKTMECDARLVGNTLRSEKLLDLIEAVTEYKTLEECEK